MGCDGGTIPKRKEIVKKKDARPRQERDKSIGEAEKWKNCDICDWVLTKPIVAGHWGHIFSKECVLQHLIDYKQRGSIDSYHLVADKTPVLDSLHTMKDVKELKLKENPNKDQSQASTSDEGTVRADFVCPITGLETNGKYKFVFSWNCGCVVSERAIKEVPNEDKCLVCQTPYKKFDLVVLHPNKKELEENQAKFLVRKMLPHIQQDKSAREKPASSQSSTSSSGWGHEGTASSSEISRYAQLRKQRQERQANASSSNDQGPSTSSGRRSNAVDNRRQHEVSPGPSPSSKSQSKRRKS